MIRPLNRPQMPAPAAQPVEAPPTDAALAARVKTLEQENSQLQQAVSASKAALVASEGSASALKQQVSDLTTVHSQRADQHAKISELEKQVADLKVHNADLLKQSTAAAPAASTPTLITIVDISEDKKGSDGALSATVKLDDTEVEVFLATSLDAARKLLRRVKEG